MRRCHSETMQDYRKAHNKEMWDRPLSQEVIYRCLSQDAPGARLIAKRAVEEQGVGK